MKCEMPEWLEKEKVKAKRELESSFVEAANRCGINWTEPHSLIVDDTANYCFQKCYELMSNLSGESLLVRAIKLRAHIEENKYKSLQESMKPRPIESAPLNEEILARGKNNIWRNVRVTADGFRSTENNLLLFVTHWLPLPSIDHIADGSKKVGGKNDQA